MSMKRFGTQLRELLAGLDRNEKLTPAEFIERANGIKNGGVSADGIISAALKNPRFLKKVVKATRRSDSGRVVLYARKGDPMVMTLERMDSLKHTVKAAQAGVRKYWASQRTPA